MGCACWLPQATPCTRQRLPGFHPSLADCYAVGTVAIRYKGLVSMLEIKFCDLYFIQDWRAGFVSVSKPSVSSKKLLFASRAVANGQPLSFRRSDFHLDVAVFTAPSAQTIDPKSLHIGKTPLFHQSSTYACGDRLGLQRCP